MKNVLRLRRLALPLALLAALLPAAAGAAQEFDSGVYGIVVDSETGEEISFANIVLVPEDQPGSSPESWRGTHSKIDGTFRIEAPPGRYTLQTNFLGYNNLRITGIQIVAGTFSKYDATLTPAAIEMGTVEVRATAIKGSDAAILANQRKSGTVSDAVGSDQMSRTSDSNAAEVLNRVTGLSVVGGRYVYVRGLGERYSATQVNGTTVGTPEPNKRVVPLDLFPSSLLEKVVVQKTYTPDQPGEFGGGVVDVNTRDFPGQPVWSLSLASGVNATSFRQDFWNYRSGGNSVFGFSQGSRDLPPGIPTSEPIAGKTIIDTTRGFSDEEITAMGRSFNRIWTPEKGSARPPYNLAGSYGREFHLFGRPLGLLGSMSLNNTFSSHDFEENTWRGSGSSLSPNTTYAGEQSVAAVLWGAMMNTSYRLSDAHTLTLRSMYNRSAEDEVRLYGGYNYSDGAEIRDTRFRYIERGLFVGSLGMDHYFESLGRSRLEWKATYSQAERNEPDRREYVYELNERITGGGYDDPDTGEWVEVPYDTAYVWELSGRRPSNSFSRMYGYTDDIERGYQADWSLPFRQWSGLPSTFKAGYMLKDKNRDMNLRRFAYQVPTVPSSVSGIDLGQEPEELLVDENIGAGTKYFTLKEYTRDTDSYFAAQEVYARYFMVDMPLFPKMRLVSGIRWETSDQRAVSDSPYNGGAAVSAGLRNTDALPSVNLTYNPVENLNLRAAFSKTVSRPDLRELSPFNLTDFQSGAEEEGNPDLKRALIRSYDLRSEYFLGGDELLAVSAFYKKIEDPIERSVFASAGLIYKPFNGAGGTLKGMEFDSRLSLSRLTPRLNGLGLSSNLTLVKSETERNAGSVETSASRPLEGQSPYVLNLGVFYASPTGGTQASVLYNVFGRRLAGVGAFGLPDTYEMPRHSLDTTVSHAATGGRLKLSLENLLDDDYRTEQEGLLVSRSKRGRSVSLSYAYGSK